MKDVHVRPIAALNLKEKSAYLRTRVDLRSWSRQKIMVWVENLLTSKCLQLAMVCPFQDVRDQNKSSGADEATSIDVCDPYFPSGWEHHGPQFWSLGGLGRYPQHGHLNDFTGCWSGSAILRLSKHEVLQKPPKHWDHKEVAPQLPQTKHTSSTAQGGGGSFKNRKPIGEVGCCESGMAERSHWWTERCLISLTLSISFSDYLPTYLSIFYVSIYLSIYLSLFHLITLSIYLSICLAV